MGDVHPEISSLSRSLGNWQRFDPL